MRNRQAFLLTVSALTATLCAVAAGVPSAAQSVAPPAIRVSECVVAAHENLGFPSGGLINAGLVVKFQVGGPQSYKRIVWRARYGSGWIDFNDAGRFDPKVDILNALYIQNFSKGFFGGPRLPFADYQNAGDPSDCSVVYAESPDGTVWSQLAPDAKPFAIPTTPPARGGQTTPETFIPGGSPIGVLSCQVQYTFLGWRSVSVTVRYKNLDTKPISQVAFRVPYGSAFFNIVDKSDSAPGVLRSQTLRKRINIPNDGYTSLDEASNCTVVSAVYADGTSWQSPNVLVSEEPLPTPPPDLDFDAAGLRWQQATMP